MLSEHDLYYLRSCLTHLRQFYREVIEDEQMVTLGSEALSDNIEWLDCFIDQHAATPLTQRAEASNG